MTEKQYSPSAKENKVKNLPAQKSVPKIENKQKEEKKTEAAEQKTEDKAIEKVEQKAGAKKEEKRVVKQEIKKKEFAIVNGRSLRISPKFAGEVCRMIKGKTPEQAIERINAVLKFRRAVPMQRREVAHQKGAGISGGKFPINVCREMKELLEQLQANANYNGVENPVIVIAKANRASMPFRRAGTRGKRAHIYIEVRDKIKLTKMKNATMPSAADYLGGKLNQKKPEMS